MSDEFRGISYYMRERDKAIAERDAERRRADNLSRDFDRDIRLYQAERDELRAENEKLHNELTYAGKTIDEMGLASVKESAELTELRAELAALEGWQKLADEGRDKTENELRELLREARSPIATLAQFNKEDPHIYEHDGVRMALVHYDVVSAASATASETLARIDAALKGDGDEKAKF